MVTSCQVRVANTQEKPLRENSLELYKKYSIQTKDGRTTKIEVLKTDTENIYGKNTKGENVTINKNDVMQVKKFDLLSTILIIGAAAAALIFIPI